MREHNISHVNASLRIMGFALMAFLVGVSVLAFLLAGLLLVHGETCQGRLFALAVVVGLPALAVLCLSWHIKRRQRALIVAASMGLLAMLLLGVDYHLTPNGRSLPGSRVRSCFTGATAYRRASMANLVPEVDQLMLGTYVFSAIDTRMDSSRTAELRGQVHEIYGEMRDSPEFECLGSVLGQTYRDLFLGDRPVGHFYEYLPSVASEERLPVVIFLHGSLGNFKGYMWVWKRIADEYGFAIVAPTFGAGNWNVPGGVDAIEQVRLYCASNPRMDPSRIYLAGVSNGGRGVCLGALRSPNAYQGLIFISPVLDSRRLLADLFVDTWGGKPILVLHGTADNRIPADYINDAVQAMAGRGLRVDCQFYEEQTHFLFFSMRKMVQDRIGNWLANERRENVKD
jgi:dienelactone hydrolase